MPPRSRHILLILAPAFLLSGVAGLIFEVIWFRQFAWVVGGTVWAATAVLTAFMAGLCLGYLLATRWHPAPATGIRAYILIELLVGVTGCGLVWLIPALPAWTAEWTGAASYEGAGLLLRFTLAALLMLVPTTAMGMTLPLLVGAITRQREDTGSRVGLLYGLNTLGACAGVLAAEFLLIPVIGLAAAGASAGLLNLLAAGLGLLLLPGFSRAIVSPQPPSARASGMPRGLVLVAALTGAAVLILEVAGFRLLLLHLRGTSEAFAVMLAAVLAGIGLGAAWWLVGKRSVSRLARRSMLICLAMAFLLPLSYAGLLPLAGLGGARLWLMPVLLFLPVCLCSGWLLPALAALLTGQDNVPAAATAKLFLANTGGAAAGAAIAGLLLLPAFGVEASLMISAALFAAAALILALSSAEGWDTWRIAAASLCLSLLTVSALGPVLWQRHADMPLTPFLQQEGVSIVARVEGLNETAQLLRRDEMDLPMAWRLVTNSHSMSNTERDSRRYMKFYVWLPMLLMPRVKNALLISYGTGSTARALTDDPEPGRIDIVDPSVAVLSFSEQVHRGNNPLDDPRVTVYIEDGRHFLLTTRYKYDLITGEPPPPRLAGIVNLYSAEYFRLMRSRLRTGGMASYWLPVDQLSVDSSRSVVAGFCEVFPDCSLWAGSNYNWMLLGSKDAQAAINTQRIQRLWAGDQRAELEALGFEHPALVGAAFIADAAQLDTFIANADPLRDNWPGRLADAAADTDALEYYRQWSDSELTRLRFRQSAWVQQRWSPQMLPKTEAAFALQPVLNNDIDVANRPWLAASLAAQLLAADSYRVPAMWLLGSGVDQANLAFAAEAVDPQILAAILHHKAVLALAGKQADRAVALFRQSPALAAASLPAAVLAACRAGETALAQSWYEQAGQPPEADDELRCW